MNANLAVIFITLAFCVVGFICSIHLWSGERRRHFPGPSRVYHMAWLSRVFAGASLVLVDCAMGSRAPVQIAASCEGTLGLGSALACLFLCATSVAVLQATIDEHKLERMRLAPQSMHIAAAVAMVAALVMQGGCTTEQTAAVAVALTNADQKAVNDYNAQLAQAKTLIEQLPPGSAGQKAEQAWLDWLLKGAPAIQTLQVADVLIPQIKAVIDDVSATIAALKGVPATQPSH